MSECPKCGASLKDDYGMVTCQQCGSFLFIDMEGVAHMGTEDASSTEAPSQSPIEAFQETPSFSDPSSDQSNNSSNDWMTPMPETSESPQSFDYNPPTESEPIEVSIEPIVEQAEELPVAHESPSQAGPSEGEFSMDNFLGYQQDPTPANPNEVPDFGPADDPLGINSYANSEISQAKDGLLVFRILISGIDTKEIRESLREAMEDSRFGWDTADILGRISKGHLAIDNVAPVKATILVNRIKRLPLKIRWEQYAITQMENP